MPEDQSSPCQSCDQPDVCSYCAEHGPKFGGADGHAFIDGKSVSFQMGWVCGLDTGDGEYHGPHIELRPPDLETGLTALRKLGWQGDA